MKSINSFILVFAIVLLQKNVLSDTNPCDLISPVYEQISQVANKNFLEKAPCELKNRDQIKDFILESITKRLPENKLKYEEKFLKLFKLIPSNFNYQEELISLYQKQVAGYYDPITKSYTIASWIPESLHQSVALHELVHLLQDQYFDLNKFIDKSMSTDKILARSAAIEGEATFLMHAALGKKNSLPSLNYIEDLKNNIISQSKKSLNSTPEILKDMITFPYAYGLKYVFREKKNLNNIFDEGYLRSPPNSTTEILYQKELLKHFAPKNHACPEKEGFTVIFKDTLGEFFYMASMAPLLLNDLTSRNWDGDIYCIYKNQEDKKLIRIELDWPNQKTFTKIKNFFEKSIPKKNRDSLNINYPQIVYEQEFF